MTTVLGLESISVVPHCQLSCCRPVHQADLVVPPSCVAFTSPSSRREDRIQVCSCNGADFRRSSRSLGLWREPREILREATRKGPCGDARVGGGIRAEQRDSQANRPGGNPRPSPSVRYRSELERLYLWGSAVPEEAIEKPRAVAAMPARAIGTHPPCTHCRCVGVVECATCAASGLYIDPVMECQGILVKVRCMGCGGSGNLMCTACGGRGHL
eukprot:TRINITY_DN19947_c0_g1_i1.p1 TRINITY_DN19947_c0_g1~~TRINITY_DN19947_c0_g1_i1.p1  ORF type:complete len:250 (+),score=10.37 TRINITY_DN19947_c0_g1_i1:109-750(+)